MHLTDPISNDYLYWSKKLFQFALANGVDDEGRFFLVVHQMLDADDDDSRAEDRFVAAVRSEYSRLLRFVSDPILALMNRGFDDYVPIVTAFLGTSVLAAERTHGLEYYEHLARLLGQPTTGYGLHGFVPSSFEKAWQMMSSHLEKCYGLYIAEPQHVRLRYTRWPRMNALLRAVDIDKLPSFFKDTGLSQKRIISGAELETLFDVWLNSRSPRLTATGVRAWNDKVRRPGIREQILRCLDQWDGMSLQVRHVGSASVQKTRFADASLIVDVTPARVKVMLRTRRRDGFPTSMQYPELDLRSADDEFYEDVLLPLGWGDNLVNGHVLHAIESNNDIRFRMKGAGAFALIDLDRQAQYESAAGLRLGVRCGVLCRSSDERLVGDYIKLISSVKPRRDPVSQLPGWVLIHDFVPTRSDMQAPKAFDCLAVDANLYILPSGGLRIGKGQNWMHGAPPRAINISGENVPETIYINGNSIPINQSVESWFQAVGTYTVIAGNKRYRLKIVEPDISVNPCVIDTILAQTVDDDIGPLDIAGHSDERHSSTLPGGLRAIGPRLELLSMSEYRNEGLRPESRRAQWAVGIIDGRASAIALRRWLQVPVGTVGASDASNIILSFANARLGIIECERFAAEDLANEREEIRRSWRSYLMVADRQRRLSRKRLLALAAAKRDE